MRGLHCSISFFFFALIAFQFTIVNAQQDSCTSPVPRNDLTFNSSVLHCVEAWSEQSFIIRYASTAANTWSYILSAADSSSFIGIAFSTSNQMMGASAIVGWIPPSGNGMVKPYFLKGKSPGEVIPDQGDLIIVNGSLKIELVSSRLYMSFQLTAEQPRVNLLYAVGPAGFFPSSPGFALREHRFMTATTINYITGDKQNGDQEGLATRRTRWFHMLLGQH